MGVILRSYAFVLEDVEWNWAHTDINDAGLHLRKEDLLSIGMKKKENSCLELRGTAEKGGSNAVQLMEDLGGGDT